MAANLFTPIKVGRYELANRILMAPLTRSRATVDNHVPTELMKEYYTQRAHAGLIITECTMIAPLTSAFYTEPGLYSAEQLTEWKKITDSVHAKGGKIFCQIWHGGRAAHPVLNDGAETIAPSAIAIEGDIHGPTGKVAHVVPREIKLDEIPHLVELFATAAKNAVEVAGFDGVEIHSANGYLIDQFLRDSSNKRTDAYGGSIENRARFLVEVANAVIKAIGADRVGVRFSLLNSYNSMIDSNPVAVAEYVSKKMNELNLAYVHVMRSDFFQAQKGDVLPTFRKHFKGAIIANMGYTKDEGNQVIASGAVDAIAFGTQFLANPDLVERFQKGAELNSPDPATFYVGGAKGYTDYPTLS
ncbi:12-oxophytodienoate reductase [Thraustotheca clavata]|uniref:12-oxophytodienoate reductase n=1 Tax=Thraustotheca clavata TaxID=74557 RepID=A0A1V9YVV6_9STRA|nr:12-oxophytodienoate reductase [Thraustotheca clavata]